MEDLYREGVEPELTRGHKRRKRNATEKGTQVAGPVEKAAGGSLDGRRYAGHLLVLARAETLENLGRKNEGIRLVEEWLEENGL